MGNSIKRKVSVASDVSAFTPNDWYPTFAEFKEKRSRNKKLDLSVQENQKFLFYGHQLEPQPQSSLTARAYMCQGNMVVLDGELFLAQDCKKAFDQKLCPVFMIR